MPVSYPQLDDEAMALLRDAVAKLGSVKAVAARLGYKRPSISMALAGSYPADTRHLRAQIVEVFAGSVACPHLGRDLAAEECRSFREAPIRTSSPAALRHWRACQHCPLNPRARRAEEVA